MVILRSCNFVQNQVIHGLNCSVHILKYVCNKLSCCSGSQTFIIIISRTHFVCTAFLWDSLAPFGSQLSVIYLGTPGTPHRTTSYTILLYSLLQLEASNIKLIDIINVPLVINFAGIDLSCQNVGRLNTFFLYCGLRVLDCVKEGSFTHH